MRENSTAINLKIDNLIVAVTQAQAPKKTDWSVLLTLGFFILALGSAVFYPLNKTAQDNQQEIKDLRASFAEHSRLTLHPVGQFKVEALERIIAIQESVMESKITNLDNKLQKETILALAVNDNKIAGLDVRIQREFNIKNERTDARLFKLEEADKFNMQQDLLELRQWRAKVSGLLSPDKAVPRIDKTIITPEKK